VRIAAVFFFAYLAAATFYVWRDLSERNPIRQKPYSWQYRETRDPRILLVNGVGWIVGVLVNAYFRGRFTNYELLPLAVFFGAALLLWNLSN
jgi:hypothetical protein